MQLAGINQCLFGINQCPSNRMARGVAGHRTCHIAQTDWAFVCYCMLCHTYTVTLSSAIRYSDDGI